MGVGVGSISMKLHAVQWSTAFSLTYIIWAFWAPWPGRSLRERREIKKIDQHGPGSGRCYYSFHVKKNERHKAADQVLQPEPSGQWRLWKTSSSSNHLPILFNASSLAGMPRWVEPCESPSWTGDVKRFAVASWSCDPALWNLRRSFQKSSLGQITGAGRRFGWSRRGECNGTKCPMLGWRPSLLG